MCEQREISKERRRKKKKKKKIETKEKKESEREGGMVAMWVCWTSIIEVILFLTIFDRAGFCSALLPWLFEFNDGLWLLLLLPLPLTWSPLSPSKAQAAMNSSTGSGTWEENESAYEVFDVLLHREESRG